MSIHDPDVQHLVSCIVAAVNMATTETDAEFIQEIENELSKLPYETRIDIMALVHSRLDRQSRAQGKNFIGACLTFLHKAPDWIV
jgi:hypothetical protein